MYKIAYHAQLVVWAVLHRYDILFHGEIPDDGVVFDFAEFAETARLLGVRCAAWALRIAALLASDFV